MTAPNLKSPITIIGKTATYVCTGSLASALANGSSSNKLLKVNVVRGANLTTSAAQVDVTIFRSSTNRRIIQGGNVPPGGSLVVLDKNEFIYLEEGDSLYAKSTPASSIELTITYEDIS